MIGHLKLSLVFTSCFAIFSFCVAFKIACFTLYHVHICIVSMYICAQVGSFCFQSSVHKLNLDLSFLIDSE